MKFISTILLSLFFIGMSLSNYSNSQSQVEPNQKSVVIIQNQEEKLKKPELPSSLYELNQSEKGKVEQYVLPSTEKGTVEKFEDLKVLEKKWVLITIGMILLLVFGIVRYLITGKQ